MIVGELAALIAAVASIRAVAISNKNHIINKKLEGIGDRLDTTINGGKFDSMSDNVQDLIDKGEAGNG